MTKKGNSAMRAARRAIACAFCFWLFFPFFCLAQEESFGDVTRQIRAERAAKQAANATQNGSLTLPTGRKKSEAFDPSSLPPPADLAKESYVIETSATKLTVEVDGTATREQSFAVRISADSGVEQFAVLTFPFTSANELVEIDYVQVRKPDGTVVQTPESNTQEMPQEVTRAAPTYSDIREKHVAVRGLGVGDLLEYKVRFRTVKPQVLGQFWFEYNFLRGATIKDERLEISYPSDRSLNVSSPELKPEVREEGGRLIYRWSHSNLERQDVDAAGARRGRAPMPTVQVSTFQSWEQVGRGERDEAIQLASRWRAE